MSEREAYAPGVPCWVETLQPDPEEAVRFYGELLGWEFEGSGSMPALPGEYFVARLHGRDVAGVAVLPDGAPAPSWMTHVRVASADDAAARVHAAGGSVVAPPFDVLPAGRMAVVADPAGARFCVWEAGAREGARRVNEPGAWSMSRLDTSDTAGAAEFYGEVFGWTTEAFGPMTMFRLPGYVGGEPEQPVSREVVALMAAGDGAARWTVDFWVADADDVAERARRLGGAVVVAPYDVPPFRQAVIADPRGASFTVSAMVV